MSRQTPLLAMQKVEGSSPFIRLTERPGNGAFLVSQGERREGLPASFLASFLPSQRLLDAASCEFTLEHRGSAPLRRRR